MRSHAFCNKKRDSISPYPAVGKALANSSGWHDNVSESFQERIVRSVFSAGRTVGGIQNTILMAGQIAG